MLPIRLIWFGRPVFHGWVVVTVVFITLFFSLGLRFAFGVYYVAILEETGWSRAATAGVFSVAMAVYAVSAVLSGALFDWLGPRLLFPIGVLLFCSGLFLSAQIETIAELYLYYGGLVGIGLAFLGFIPHMALVARWFVRRRGLASAVALSGVGSGGLSMAVLSERLIAWMGWREAFVIFAVMGTIVLVPLTAWLHREAPAALGLHPDGDPESSHIPPHAGADADSLALALRRPAFWLLFFAMFLFGGTSNSMAVHQMRLFLDQGVLLGLAAVLFGVTGLFRSVGTLIWGALSDHAGHRVVLQASIAMGLAGLVVLLLAGSWPYTALLVVFALLWGVGFNGITPVYAAIVGDWFHGPNLGKIFGLLDLGFGVASALGPWLMGYLFDKTGSYNSALWGMLVTTVATGALLWLTARPRPSDTTNPRPSRPS